MFQTKILGARGNNQDFGGSIMDPNVKRSLGGEAEIIKTLGDRLCIQMFERSRGARGNNQDFRGSIILWSKSEIRFLHA